MGKDLKGKELGSGLTQRKDGKYYARIYKNGKNYSQYFDRVSEAKQWLVDMRYDIAHNNVASNNMTLDAWYEFWISNFKQGVVRDSTLAVYKRCYIWHVKERLGHMLMSEIKPYHCQNLAVELGKELAYSSARYYLTIVSNIFSYAVDNKVIPESPMTDKIRLPNKQEKQERTVLTKTQQQTFLQTVDRSCSIYKDFYRLALQTGMRAGELCALQWNDIDFVHNVIHVNKTLYRYGSGDQYQIHKPKTQSGIRDIPMTNEAKKILSNQKEVCKKLKVIPIKHRDYVFIKEDGSLYNNSVVDNCLKSICKRGDLPHITMHNLRHTFATRCIEAGMRPKTLQKILGHSTLQMTMDLYVHVTSDELVTEMSKFESAL